MKKILPSISIIIPIFKVKDYIIDCLQSVVNQDYKGELECILIDDCGEDGSIELCKNFIAKQKSLVHFKILYNDKNIKQSASRNKGMRYAHGEYIYFLDSDDWILPSTLSMMVEILNLYPDSQLVQAGIERTNPNVFKWLDCQSWKDQKLEYTEDKQWIEYTCSARLDMIPMTPVSKLMSRNFLEEHNFAFVEGIFHEDEIWLALIAKYLTKVSFCHKNLYIYRIRSGSTTDGGQKKHYYDWQRVWLEIFKLFDNKFCPKRMLMQIETDTSHFYHETNDKKVRRMIIGIKYKLMKYCSFKSKIHIFLWIIKYCIKAI